MFLTLTVPSYGAIKNGICPVDPESYDYRRAALDALHFPKPVDRFVQNLRRCDGFRVQYFAAIEPQQRLAPHVMRRSGVRPSRDAAPGHQRHLSAAVVAEL